MKELKELIGYYLMEVYEKGEKILPAICNISVARTVFLQEFKRLKLDLSNMEESEKQELWAFVNQHYPHETQYHKIETCKIITVISYLL